MEEGYSSIVVDALNNQRFKPAHINPDYIARAHKIAKLHKGNKCARISLMQNGNDGSIVRFNANAFMVIMPMRADSDEDNLIGLDTFRSKLTVPQTV
jgi:hypothetical protein